MLGYLTKAETAILKKVTNKMRDFLKEDLILLKLFGSKVKGNFVSDSDIDIFLVIKNKNIKLRDKLYDILFEVDPYYEFKISPIIYSEFEYKQNIKLKSPFIENIKKEGLEL